MTYPAQVQGIHRPRRAAVDAVLHAQLQGDACESLLEWIATATRRIMRTVDTARDLRQRVSAGGSGPPDAGAQFAKAVDEHIVVLLGAVTARQRVAREVLTLQLSVTRGLYSDTVSSAYGPYCTILRGASAPPMKYSESLPHSVVAGNLPAAWSPRRLASIGRAFGASAVRVPRLTLSGPAYATAEAVDDADDRLSWIPPLERMTIGPHGLLPSASSPHDALLEFTTQEDAALCVAALNFTAVDGASPVRAARVPDEQDAPYPPAPTTYADPFARGSGKVPSFDVRALAQRVTQQTDDRYAALRAARNASAPHTVS